MIERAELACPFDEVPEVLEVDYVLRLDELRSRRDFLGEALRSEFERGRRGILDRADEQLGGALELRARHQLAGVAKRRGDPHERRRVEIEDVLGFWVIAEARVVASQQQDVRDADRGKSEEIGLQRDPVSVPALQLADGLEVLGDHRG